MKQTLQLRLGQSLTLTPQLRQAIRLLQLSSTELETEINLALESNPLLERLDEVETDSEAATGDDHRDLDTASESDPGAGDDSEPPLDIPDWATEYERVGTGTRAGHEGEEERDMPLADADQDLHDHLLWQLNLTSMSARDHAIAMVLIDAINEDGYLDETLHAVREVLLPELTVETGEIEAVLHRIQHFDPLGVGARSLAECLCIQLNQQRDQPYMGLAREVAADHLEALAKLGPERLATQLDVSVDHMHAAVQLLRSLNPRPGSAFSRTPPEYVVPDAYVVRQQDQWVVRLGPGCRPRLGTNQHYESLIGSASKDNASYLRGQLQEARWLIKSLEARADTVLRVAECIVRHQSNFLEFGPEAMRPLVLREVADELELHESTISRVTTRKYLHTPRGTFEFKHFFSSGLSTADGGSASSTAIRAMLRRLIEAEEPRRPLSDAALVKALEQEGVSVARRTVAKYREAMNIPASNERQGLE